MALITTSCKLDNDDEPTNDYKFPDIQEETISGDIGGHTYVDLGLPSGIKWATYNVGATKATEIGDYFAWGETSSKTSYELTNYKWYQDVTFENMSKYILGSSVQKTDYKYYLDGEDDAAAVNWGSSWRMPTAEELKELLNGCYWKFEEDFKGSGTAGIIGVSINNGASIFFPAGGAIYGERNGNVGNLCNYWSSTLTLDDSNGSHYAYYMSFNSTLYYSLPNHFRYDGRNVRAVTR